MRRKHEDDLFTPLQINLNGNVAGSSRLFFKIHVITYMKTIYNSVRLSESDFKNLEDDHE